MADLGNTLEYTRFRARIAGRRGLSAWLGLLTAQASRATLVAISGSVAALTLSAVPVLFSQFIESVSGSTSGFDIALPLIAIVLLSGVAGWIKERAELRLVFAARFLVYRSLFDEAVSGADGRGSHTGRFTTHPAQISQFVYLIDLALVLLQAAVVSTFVVLKYGAVGWIALGGILVFTSVTVRLVHLIGAVYARFIKSEAARIDRVRDFSDSSGRLLFSGLHQFVALWLTRARQRQEPILRERARLQVVNGVATTCAVPVVVTIGAIVAVANGQSVSSLIPLLVAAGLLSAALQEAVTDYRVIRLTVPMLREWDERRVEARDSSSMYLLPVELLTRSGVTSIDVGLRCQDRDSYLRNVEQASMVSARSGHCAWIAPDPQYPSALLEQWISDLPEPQQARLLNTLRCLGMPTDYNPADTPGRLATLSRGERFRLAVGISLSLSPQACVIAASNFGSLDLNNRALVMRVMMAEGIHVLLVGKIPDGVPFDRVAHITFHTETFDASFTSVESTLVTHEQGASADLEHRSVLAVAEVPGETSQPEERRQSINDDPRTDRDEPSGVTFPNPEPTARSTLRIVNSMFGPWGVTGVCVTTAVTAVLAAALPVVLNAANSEHGAASIWELCSLLLGVVVAAVAGYLLQFRVPIIRLSLLHGRIAQRFSTISGRDRTGELVGRFGEDFAQMQMQVPASLVGAVAISAELAGVVVVIGIGHLSVMVVALLLLPVAFWVYRRGERRLVAASIGQAKSRGSYLDVATSILDSHAPDMHPSLVVAAKEVHERRRFDFAAACAQVVSAMMHRRTELQFVSFALFAVGMVVTVSLQSTHSFIPPAVLGYFVYALTTRISPFIEAVQGVSLSVTTAGRVVSVLDVPESAVAVGPASAVVVSNLQVAIDQADGRAIQVTGRSGGGKSVSLRALHNQMPSGTVVLLDDDAPIATVSVTELVAATGQRERGGMDGALLIGGLPWISRQQLMVDYSVASSADIVILDETLSSMTPKQQEETLAQLARAFAAERRTLVVVSHTAGVYGALRETFEVPA